MSVRFRHLVTGDEENQISGLERLEEFLQRLCDDVYPEPPGEPHLSITAQTIDFNSPAGPDQYWAFFLEKTAA